MEERVPETYVTWSWAVPGRTSKEFAELEIAASIFGGGRNSRLYEKLVHEQERLNSASASIIPGELSSIFMVSAELKKGENAKNITQVVEDMFSKFLEDGPSKKELTRVKSSIENSMIRTMESISSKGSILASGAIYADDPGFIHKKQFWQSSTTRKSIKKVINQWLTKGFYKLDLVPFGNYKTLKPTVDRSKIPDFKAEEKINLPPLQHAILTNGIRVTLAERNSVPTVNLAIRFDAGRVTDYDVKFGTSSFTFGNMNEGTKTLSSLEFNELKTKLGARIGFSNGLDSSNISLSALKKNLSNSIKLWADVIKNPAFRSTDIERDRSLTLAQLEQIGRAHV